MRILLITQWFDPEPAFKGLLFARALRNAGHEIEVVTGFPNYPGGKVYPGYRIKWFQREEIDGVRVNRVPLYPSHDSSAVGRVWNYVSFAISACLYGVFGACKPDVIYAYHPPMPVGFAAAVVSLFRRAPFVVDINDLWPDTLAATGMIRNKQVLRAVDKVCQWIYGRASSIAVVTPGFRQRLIKRGVPEEKIEIIYNWCDEQALRLPKQTNPSAFGMGERFNIVFAGNMGKAQALHVVIKAAKHVQLAAPRVQFVFVGDGVEMKKLEGLAKELQVDNLRFLPRMSMTEVGRVLAMADALLVHLKDDLLFEITVPSKTQAYMAVGKPILMAVKGDAAHLIEDSGAGICALPENEESIANAVLKMVRLPSTALEEMGRCGREYYDRHLSLAVGAEKFVRLFSTVRSDASVPMCTRTNGFKLSKRLFDFVGSFLLLTLLALPLMVVAFLVRWRLGPPVAFTQERPGLGGKPFRILKFRTMTNERDAAGNLLPDTVRVTSFGQFLRSTSMDELPALWNVLKGDMSLVGPRPLLMRYLPRYTAEQARRHEVRPGITGWAQVNGRNALSWEDRFKLDVWYVDNQSIFLDMKIILKTLGRVLKRDGISQLGQATMSEFLGSVQDRDSRNGSP